MKKSFLLAIFLLSTVSFADTTAIEQLLYQGINQVEELNLSTEKTKTEYRNVQVPSTCYRTEYRRRCTRRPRICRPVCDRFGRCRTSCSPGGTICRNVMVQVPYSCIRTVRQAYQVHDYFVETNIRFQFNNRDVLAQANEQFTLTVTGETVNLGVVGSNNYFLVLDNKSETFSMGSGVKNINLIYKVSLVPTVSALSVLSNEIRNVKLRNKILTFELGAGFNHRAFTQQIKIFQNRRLGTDPLILDKFLTQNDMSVQTTSNSSILSIDLGTLGINIPRRMRIILDTKFKLDEEKVLNRNQIKTKVSANWIFR